MGIGTGHHYATATQYQRERLLQPYPQLQAVHDTGTYDHGAHYALRTPPRPQYCERERSRNNRTNQRDTGAQSSIYPIQAHSILGHGIRHPHHLLHTIVACLQLFFIMIFMLMSGLFTDVRSMPDWAQDIAFFNPPRYFINIMRSVFQRGGDIIDNNHNFVMLAIFAFIANIWAVMSYRK